jgi:ribosomal protein S18 acetylase RimI-like enzyme
MYDRSLWPYLEAANQAELLAYIGTSALVESHFAEDITWVITGVASNDYNGVLWARLSSVEADAQVPRIVDRFRARNLPALWHIDPDSHPLDLSHRLEALGCQRLKPGTCMAADLTTLASNNTSLPGLTIERVTTTDALTAWIDVWMQDDPGERAPLERLYMSLGLSSAQPLRHYLARLDGIPVGVSQLFLGKQAAGLYCVAVVPAARRQGIGTALTLTLMADARAFGYRLGALGPSPDGYPMYHKLGFELFPSPFVGYTLWIDP